MDDQRGSAAVARAAAAFFHIRRRFYYLQKGIFCDECLSDQLWSVFFYLQEQVSTGCLVLY